MAGVHNFTRLAMGCTTERGLPSLARGWRTPDPSPTRSAADLPSCKPRSWFTVMEERSSHSDDGNSESDNDDADTVIGQFCPPSDLLERGRSQVRRSDLLPDGSCNHNASTFIASRTPSPAPLSYSGQDCDYDYDLPMGLKLSRESASFSTICPDSECGSSGPSPCDSATVHDDDDVRTSAAKAPVPPAVKPVAAWTGPAVPPPPPAPPVLRGVLGMPDDCPSVGSMNHPHACADYCKYAKKPKGCKDGDACVRCHICTCKKPKPVVKEADRPNARNHSKKSKTKMHD